ncbi:hypothetical protein FHR38_005837 [Micromonospora polyrhachis]|uniref:Uncharacterized protein n=1 Tax=Micromonospora polyrhachis TaxID=1282883 RepID=A0A7W7WSL1_9ACTN|nr:hypothetical protein [Micromonospora polyrhachis]
MRNNRDATTGQRAGAVVDDVRPGAGKHSEVTA